MKNVGIGHCMYCQVDNVPVTATPETDVICSDCHRLVANNFQKAIRQIREFNKSRGTVSHRRKVSLEELERKKDESLKALMKTYITLDEE